MPNDIDLKAAINAVSDVEAYSRESVEMQSDNG